MKFPTTLGKRNLITVPKNIAKDLELEYGDEIYVEIVKKRSIEHLKDNLEKGYSHD